MVSVRKLSKVCSLSHGHLARSSVIISSSLWNCWSFSSVVCIFISYEFLEAKTKSQDFWFLALLSIISTKVSIFSFGIISFLLTIPNLMNANSLKYLAFENTFVGLTLFNLKVICDLKYCHTFAVYYFTNTLNQTTKVIIYNHGKCAKRNVQLHEKNRIAFQYEFKI